MQQFALGAVCIGLSKYLVGTHHADDRQAGLALHGPRERVRVNGVVVDNRLAARVAGCADDLARRAVAVARYRVGGRETHFFFGDLAAVDARRHAGLAFAGLGIQIPARLDVQCAKHADAEVTAAGFGTDCRAIAVDDEGTLVGREEVVRDRGFTRRHHSLAAIGLACIRIADIAAAIVLADHAAVIRHAADEFGAGGMKARAAPRHLVVVVEQAGRVRGRYGRIGAVDAFTLLYPRIAGVGKFIQQVLEPDLQALSGDATNDDWARPLVRTKLHVAKQRRRRLVDLREGLQVVAIGGIPPVDIDHVTPQGVGDPVGILRAEAVEYRRVIEYDDIRRNRVVWAARDRVGFLPRPQ